MDYECKVLAEMEIVYSEASVELNYIFMQRKLFLNATITHWYFNGLNAGK
jgi:hypothetical protein